MNILTLRRTLVSLALGTLTSAIGSANTIGFLSNTVGPSNTEVSYTLTLPTFDPTLGTLSSVTIYFQASENTSNMTLTNTSGATITFDASVTANLVRNFVNSATAVDKYTGETLQLLDTGVGTALGSCGDSDTPAPGTCDSITLAGSGGSQNYASMVGTTANTDAVYGLSTGTGVQGLTGVIKNGTSIANYATGSNFTLSGITLNSLTLSGTGGNISATQATTGTFQAEVDYTYTPNAGAPEPGTMALFGFGLVGLGMAGRKRFAR
jgi:hypothetical protein